ncbi:hypothetical protein STRIP9103_04993, partial [Streptomyces ipomoeae 91-03]
RSEASGGPALCRISPLASRLSRLRLRRRQLR